MEKMALNPHKTLTGIIIGRKVLDQRCSILSVSISGEANGQRSKMRLSEYKRELVLILSSVSILSNGQRSMVNGQRSMVNGQNVKIAKCERNVKIPRWNDNRR